MATIIQTTPFDIIDNKSVNLKISNPANPEELIAIVSIRDSKLAQELKKSLSFKVSDWELRCNHTFNL